ncbi:MAG: tetratricopeptide repeat protein [Limisphaerales bacterium]
MRNETAETRGTERGKAAAEESGGPQPPSAFGLRISDFLRSLGLRISDFLRSLGLSPRCRAVAAGRPSDFLRSLLLLALVVAAYWPALHAGFIWDDDSLLTENPVVKAADGLRHIWFQADFPLALSSLWLEWRLWGMHPMGYHVANVLLHALSAVLLWRVLARLKVPGAWLAAAVFAVHPVNVESVAWIAERKNTLAMLFFALSLLAYARFEDTQRRRWYGLALAGFALALLSKTAVAPLPIVLLGLAWWRRGRLEWRDLLRMVPFFGLAILLGLMSIGFQHEAGAELVRTDSFWSRLAGAGWAVWFYLYKALLPVRLAFVYPQWRVNPANLLSYVPGLLVAASLLLCWRYRAGWGRAWLLSGGCFVAMLFPLLGFFNNYFMLFSPVAGRWQYFAIMAPIALASAGITLALGRARRQRTVLTFASCGLLLLTLSVLTWRQCGVFLNSETLWRDTLAKNPESWMAHYNLAVELQEHGQAGEAMEHYGQAIRYYPRHAKAHNNLALLLVREGRTPEAIEHYHAALEIEPRSAGALNNLGVALAAEGDYGQAVVQLQRALDIEPRAFDVLMNLARFLKAQGKTDAALQCYRKGVALFPGEAEPLRRLAGALAERGQIAEAVSLYRKALVASPNQVDVLLGLGNALASQKNYQEAVSSFRRALKVEPDSAGLHYNVGMVLGAQGKVGEARKEFQEAARLKPDFPEALRQLLLTSGPQGK